MLSTECCLGTHDGNLSPYQASLVSYLGLKLDILLESDDAVGLGDVIGSWGTESLGRNEKG